MAGVYCARVARRRGWDPADVLPGLVLAVVAAYAGARLLGAMSSWSLFVADPVGAVLQPGALSFFGGLALGGLAILAYLRWKRYPVGEVADALTPVGPVLYAIFRLGCLLNGDDYGKPSTLPWGMTFPQGSPPTSVPVHPTQIYEILLMIPIFAWLWRRRDSPRPPGGLAFELCVWMGLERFVVEFWRTAESVAGLTLPQWLALGLILIGIVGRSRLRPG